MTGQGSGKLSDGNPECEKIGGPGGDRTLDHSIKSRVLYR